MSGPWKDEKEAAAYTRFAVSTLQKKRCLGGGPRYSKKSGRIRYHTDDLDAWMRETVVSSTSEMAEVA